MQLNELKRKTPNKTAKRVGLGGKRGKTSGRGTKGQKARAGHSIRPAIREILKKIPKMRGRGVNALKSIQPKPAVVNLAALEQAFNAGDTVTAQVLADRGLIRARMSVGVSVKILGTGELTKKLTISDCDVSAAARTKIEAAGGTIA